MITATTLYRLFSWFTLPVHDGNFQLQQQVEQHMQVVEGQQQELDVSLTDQAQDIETSLTAADMQMSERKQVIDNQCENFQSQQQVEGQQQELEVSPTDQAEDIETFSVAASEMQPFSVAAVSVHEQIGRALDEDWAEYTRDMQAWMRNPHEPQPRWHRSILEQR